MLFEKKFKVVDLYDGKDVLGYADNMWEVKRLARQQVNDTDGECSVYYYPFDEVSGKYQFGKRKFVEGC